MTTKGAVTSLAVRPDGALLAFGRDSGCIQIFDLVKGERVVERLEAATSANRATQFSPNGAYLATAGFDGVISIWDAERFEPVARIETGADNAHAISFRGDSNIIGATGAGDGIFRMFEVATGKEAWRSDPTKGGCNSVTFVGMNGVLGQANGMLSGWRHEEEGSAKPLYAYDGSFEAFVNKIYCLASHGNLLLAGGNGGTGVNLYDATGDWPRLLRFEVPRPMAVNGVAFSQDGRTVAAACSDGVVRITQLDAAILAVADPAEVKFLDALKAAADDHATRLVYADWLEERAAAGDATRAASLRGGHTPADVRTMSESRPSADELGRPIHRSWTRDAIVSSVGFVNSSTIVSGHFDGAIRFWPYRTSSLSASYEPSVVLKADGEAWSIANSNYDEIPWPGLSD